MKAHNRTASRTSVSKPSFNSMSKKIVLAAAMSLAISAAANAEDSTSFKAENAPSAADRSGYAESIYGEYSDSSSGSVSFKTLEIDRGPLKQIQGMDFATLIGVPSQVLRASDNGFQTSKHELTRSEDLSEFSDLYLRAEDMSKVGYPLARGEYRILQVQMSMDGKTSDHRALELCWKEQNYCFLLDPNVEFIDSIANNRIQFRAQGIGPLIEYGEADSLAKSGRCGLASDPSKISKTTTYPATTVTYRNIFGNRLVEKSLGGQQSGVRCDTSCKAQPFGYSNPSSAFGRLGWRTACDHEFNSGTNSAGTTAKYIGITGCSHRYTVAAKFEITKRGEANGVDLNVDVGGSSDTNGGFVVESCGRF